MKSLFDLAQSFSKVANKLTSIEDLANSLEACARELGFRHFALLHHVDPGAARSGTIQIDNYPSHFVEWFIEKRLFGIDPMLCASLRTNLGFAWDEVHRLITLDPKHHAILDHARREGLAKGVTVPANIPGEAHGSCSFACARGVELTWERILSAQIVGGFAFQTARRLALKLDDPRQMAVELTPRQRDCVELVAQGKTDWEIGRILGLAEDSVTKVVNAARHRYGVVNRPQLVVAALYGGQITFNELFHWQFLSAHWHIRPE